MKGYEFDISKLAENSIIMKGQINDVVFGLKESTVYKGLHRVGI